MRVNNEAVGACSRCIRGYDETAPDTGLSTIESRVTVISVDD